NNWGDPGSSFKGKGKHRDYTSEAAAAGIATAGAVGGDRTQPVLPPPSLPASQRRASLPIPAFAGSSSDRRPRHRRLRPAAGSSRCCCCCRRRRCYHPPPLPPTPSVYRPQDAGAGGSIRSSDTPDQYRLNKNPLAPRHFPLSPPFLSRFLFGGRAGRVWGRLFTALAGLLGRAGGPAPSLGGGSPSPLSPGFLPLASLLTVCRAQGERRFEAPSVLRAGGSLEDQGDRSQKRHTGHTYTHCKRCSPCIITKARREEEEEEEAAVAFHSCFQGEKKGLYTLIINHCLERGAELSQICHPPYKKRKKKPVQSRVT
ncbi:hypothetical protein E2320_000704, partial [Naja naja]